jgi:hypothetical protein
MSGSATPLLRRCYCDAEECRKFSTCPVALRPEVRLFAEVVREEVRLYSAPHAMKCYEPAHVVRPLALPIAQPKSRKAAAALYGSDFDPSRCIRAIVGLMSHWQCGHKNGKGTKGLYCGRHA